MSGIPSSGAVLGVDVGYSVSRASSAICRLEWDEVQIRWRFRRFRFEAGERRRAIDEITEQRKLLAAAFDGPFRADLREIGAYRSAERILTRGIGRIIGKPSQSNSPVGRKLNCATNVAVKEVLNRTCLARASHAAAVHEFAVVEAFPSTYMGLMLPEGHELNGGPRGKKSDRYFEKLCGADIFRRIFDRFLPGHRYREPDGISNHDERAAFVCALTALGVAADDFMAVGDEEHGWIVLPPKEMIRPSLFEILAENAQQAIYFAASKI